jgi:4a-hydroxytetrahydrobiopterin dehydratase
MSHDGLAGKSIFLCKPDTKPLAASEYEEFLQELPDWNIMMYDGLPTLERAYTFKSFAHALAFTNRVGDLAEIANHHPALLTEWGKVTVAWWTHNIKGLHRNDFIMAARCDALYHAWE